MRLTKPFVIFFLLSVSFIKFSLAQSIKDSIRSLNKKQEAIVSITAYATKGDLTLLKSEIIQGLDEGVTINEMKEAMVQLYAYAGFPRSLNALQTLLSVLKERKNKNIIDSIGVEPAAVSDTRSKLEIGTEIQTRLLGRKVSGEVYEFVPLIDQFLKEHLFADIFARDNLDWKTRELVTITILATLGNVENQLRSHFNTGIYNGLSAGQLNQLVEIVSNTIGAKEGNTAREILQSILKNVQKDK